MTSEYHCGNCPLYNIACPLKGKYAISSGTINMLIKEVGCHSHPSSQAALQAEGAKQEREWVLKSIEDWVGGASQELDYGYYDPTVYVFELEAKIKYLRQNQSTGDGGK
jgi:hypothetical protein